MTVDQLIDQLGGEAAVAAECGCGLSAISNWKRRGLPRGRLVDLVKMAKRVGLPLTLEQAESAAFGTDTPAPTQDQPKARKAEAQAA